ncbi:hypothetical protein G6O67_001108 [Ophiocordyceps sinensis]|uniref:Uncharacterized protein n=1 Tax=Ophiocordyceps sinensis TaxID=72228 RepID=A0A8H4V8H4_9HYPO|nr:hypothetical protein G6O67_001108 [Ophiocordyceps sinensis]
MYWHKHEAAVDQVPPFQNLYWISSNLPSPYSWGIDRLCIYEHRSHKHSAENERKQKAKSLRLILPHAICPDTKTKETEEIPEKRDKQGVENKESRAKSRGQISPQKDLPAAPP